MARRTKQEALATRNALLDAAECLFQMQGVSSTTLQHIALRAGATRGAVYWHFKDKANLFNAMMERVTLPLEAYFNAQPTPAELNDNPEAYSLEHTRNAILNALHQIVHDTQTRRVLEIATQKVEFVDSHCSIRARHLALCDGFLCRVQQGLVAASRHENFELPLPPETAARGLHALVDGLIQNWLLDPQSFDLVDVGNHSLEIYLTGLGFNAEHLGLALRRPIC